LGSHTWVWILGGLLAYPIPLLYHHSLWQHLGSCVQVWDT
jgi:hypothetical protein